MDEEFKEDEIRQHIRRLKKGKAAGIFGNTNEAWMYMQVQAEQELFYLLIKDWKREIISDDWKEAMTTPLYKKEEEGGKQL